LFLLGVVIGLFGWAWDSRLFHSQIISLKEREFTKTAILSGMSTFKIITKEHIPYIIPLIMAATIEHMSKNIGYSLLEKIKKKSKFAFITTPKDAKITGKSMNYNPYETHLCEWSLKELSEFGDARDIGANNLLLQMDNR